MNLKLKLSLIAAGLLGIALLAVLIWESWADTTKMPASIALLIFGGMMGWLFGVLVSPYAGEKETFSEYSKFVSAGVGGFIAGKADTMLSYIGRFDSLATVRTASALSAFMLATIIVFYFRSYARI